MTSSFKYMLKGGFYVMDKGEEAIGAVGSSLTTSINE